LERDQGVGELLLLFRTEMRRCGAKSPRKDAKGAKHAKKRWVGGGSRGEIPLESGLRESKERF
jgi:hypothetical protein